MLPRGIKITEATGIFWVFLLLMFVVIGPGQVRSFERIVSLGPINTENVFLLGAGERLVGNTNYCTRPEGALDKVKIGTVMQVSVEKIISLHPDLVLATALTRPEQVRQLEAMGIRVVRFKQPASFAEICLQFLELGDLLGLQNQAQDIVRQTRIEVAHIQAGLATSDKVMVLLQVGAQPLFASVSSSFTHEFITLAGGINITGDQNSGATGLEKVLVQNPQVIIIAIMGSETGTAAQEKKRWSRMSVLKAVRDQRVHVVDPDLVCSPSPATFVQTLRMMVGLIHPEREAGPLVSDGKETPLTRGTPGDPGVL